MPKPAATRQRRNKVAGARTLHPVTDADVPSLPDIEGGWHAMTAQWWASIWSSPMVSEWDSSDNHGLYMLARLVDAFWRAETAQQAKDMAGEIRLQSQRFGLSPIDRRRLQWEIDRGDEAGQRTQARRQASKPKAVTKKNDPRQVLGA